MASCITEQWAGDSCPQVQLEVRQTSSTATTATLSWVLYYYPHGYAADTSSSRPYTVKIGGTTVASGNFNCSGYTGVTTIASGTRTIDKLTYAQTVSFSCSYQFNLTWSGVYGGTKSASGSITIAAKTSYTIRYNANGGSGAPGSQTKWHGTNLTLSSTAPTRTGYSFKGWALSKAYADAGTWYYQPGGACGKNENLTLYAVWEANTYTVSFNANGGSGAPASQTKTHDVTLTLSGKVPTRPNHDFEGWSTSANGGAVYKAGDSYTANANITLYAVWSLSYAKPRISEYSVARCDSNGSTNDSGTYALVKFSWSTDDPVSSISVQWIAADGTTGKQAVSASGTSGNVSVVVGNGGLSTEATYTIQVTVSAIGGTNSASKTLGGVSFVIDLLHGGNGVAFGKPAETPEYADFGWSALFDNFIGIYGRDLSGNIKLALQPQNENGNTVIGWSNYDLKSGNTNVYGHDVYIGVSNIASPSTYRPYFRKGDSITCTIQTAGYVTNAGTEVHFWLPLTKPVIGNPTVTVASGNGLVLRQAGNYTHGSTATVATYPSKYTYSLYPDVGIRVVATFSTTTNASNNDPVGVEWNGTITFS